VREKMPITIWILLLGIIPATLFYTVILPAMRKRKEEPKKSRAIHPKIIEGIGWIKLI